LEGKPLNAGRIGFILAPRLNAVGRLGHALRGVELLMSENEHEANAIALELEALLRHFEPFGPSNPTPVLVSRGVRLAAPARVIGDGHLKLRLQTGGPDLEAIGWGMGALASELGVGSSIDIAYRLERDEWNGQARLQAKLAAVHQ
ncbi:MAG: hypothetical protein ACHQRL_05630, partial [Gemmatimonadales bacterium]